MNPASNTPADRIYLSAPHMSRNERDALIDAFDSNWIAPAGPALTEFEARTRAVAQTEAAVGLSSGTAALHLALVVLGIGPGDIVICPTVTFVASANVIKYVGATPHFVDCDPSTGNIDPESLVTALANLTRAGHRPAAVMTVDLYGACADYTTIEAICNRYEVPIVEDAAEAIGATHDKRPAGSFGTLAAYSFNGNKLVTTGGGGALVGPEDLIARATHLAGQARTAVRHFEHDEVGYAYRMSNLSAAIGVAQLKRLDNMMLRTRTINERYVRELGSIEGVRFASQTAGGQGNAWLTVAHLDLSLHSTPAAVCDSLAAHNIEARPTWKPMHLQPIYSDAQITGGNGAETHFATGICLPSGSSMSHDDQSRVIAAVRSALSADQPTVIDIKQPQIDLAQPVDISYGIDLTDALARQRRDNQAPTN